MGFADDGIWRIRVIFSFAVTSTCVRRFRVANESEGNETNGNPLRFDFYFLN